MAQVSAKEVLRLLAAAMGGVGEAGGVRGALNLFTGNGLESVRRGYWDLPRKATKADAGLILSEMEADRYPRRFHPEDNHTVAVTFIPGEPQRNRGLDRNLAERAAEQQSLDEHNAALTKYIVPGMTPRQVNEAVMRGIEEEKKLDKWWDESKPRKIYHPSSSAVSGVRITPTGNIEVEWGSNPGTWYTFRSFANTHEASKEMKKLLTCDSIGKAVMPYQRNGKPLEFKDPRDGWWNKDNYDGAFAV